MVAFQNDIEKCLEILQAGGLILYPTDTIWGIGCDATNPNAIEKIYQLKQREDKRSMIILVADEKDIFDYVKDPDKKVFDYLQKSNKPTTVIYEDAINLPSNLISSDKTIAIRIIKDAFCNTLIEQFKKPIVSTSANISGEPAPKNFAEVTTAIKNGVEHIVQHRQHDLRFYEPSSIIRFNKDGSMDVLRK